MVLHRNLTPILVPDQLKKSDNIDVLLRKLRVHAFSHGVTWKLTP